MTNETNLAGMKANLMVLNTILGEATRRSKVALGYLESEGNIDAASKAILSLNQLFEEADHLYHAAQAAWRYQSGC
jgi:hypothetical protein